MRVQHLLFLFAVVFLFQNALAQDCRDTLSSACFLDTSNCLGYPIETHFVTTDDSYKLKLFRVQAKGGKITSGKPVILMWHGLLDSSDGWIVNEEHLAPGYVLANKGYDVWFGNSRGNKYSIQHSTLDATKNTEYWDFSWQHMAEHDVPAALTFIGEKTGKKITYIGHSQGTAQMFAALADPKGKHPAIKTHLKKFAALAPVAYMANVRSTFINGLSRVPLLAQLMSQVGKYGIFTPNWVCTDGGRTLCKTFPWTCSLGLSLMTDDKPGVNNEARLEFVAGHFPAGTSVMDLKHWKQSLNSGGKFQKYDFGAEANKMLYGSSGPQQYDLSLITEEVGLFAGTDDLLATPADVGKLYKDMKNAKKLIRYYPLGHLSFIIGKELTYMDDLIEFIEA